jgi:hypothetical protein
VEGKNDVDFQKKASEMSWQWSEDEMSLFRSISNIDGYGLEVVRPKKFAGWYSIRVVYDAAEIYSFQAHSLTIFTQVSDTLYLADYSPRTTGCTIIAFDLKSKKVIWRTALRALGPPEAHSAYSNQVTMRVNGDEIVVFGNESNGKYVELLSRKTGKTVGHKVFEERH